MFSDERRAQILSYLEQNRSVAVSDLAQLFSSSESTIRRDLQELEQNGQVRRTHGGAIALGVASFEPTWQERNVQNADAKVRIGKIGASLVQDNQTILLDSGTTTLQIARHLQAQNVTVVTNSLAIASELSGRPNVHLVMLGGELRTTTGAFVGPFAEQMLSHLHVDTLFLGANGMDASGVTTPNAVEAATKQAMLKAANQIVVASDQSKIGQVSFVQVCHWKEISMLLTDNLEDTELRDVLNRNQVEVKFAPELIDS